MFTCKPAPNAAKIFGLPIFATNLADTITPDELLAATDAVIAARQALRTASVTNFDTAIKTYLAAKRRLDHLNTLVDYIDEADEADAA